MQDKSIKISSVPVSWLVSLLLRIFQCEQLEGEMVGYLQLQRSHLHRAMDVLHTYATIISQVSGADRPIVVGQIDNIYIQLKLYSLVNFFL